MQETGKIDLDGLYKLVETIFTASDVHLYERYSRIDSDLIRIADLNAFKSYYRYAKDYGNNTLKFAIFYNKTESLLQKQKVDIYSKYSICPEFRYLVEGVGLIYFEISQNEDSTINFTLSANSKEDIDFNEHTESEIWKWDIIEHESQKLVAKLEELRIK